MRGLDPRIQRRLPLFVVWVPAFAGTNGCK